MNAPHLPLCPIPKRGSINQGAWRKHVSNLSLSWTTGRRAPLMLQLWSGCWEVPVKTALLTFTNLCRQHKRSVGAFFASNWIANCNNSSRIIITLVVQLIQSLPSTAKCIDKALCQDPQILSKGCEVQMKALIVEPIKWIATMTHFLSTITFGLKLYPTLIVINSLDKVTGKEVQTNIIRIIAYRQHHKWYSPTPLLPCLKLTRTSHCRGHPQSSIPVSQGPYVYHGLMEGCSGSSWYLALLQEEVQRDLSQGWWSTTGLAGRRCRWPTRWQGVQAVYLVLLQLRLGTDLEP